MAEHRTSLIALSAALNILCPLPILQCLKYAILSYASVATFSLLILSYIYYKKRYYFAHYLCRTYTPGLKLLLVTHLGDVLTLLIMYPTIYCTAKDLNKTLFGFVSISHVLLLHAIFMILYRNNNKNKVVIAYTRHKYRLGIIAHDVGGPAGLQKGQPVEIVQESAGGYVVKDSSNQDFQVSKEDIESILDIV